jgi:4-amino-4-deoxy-L-arabinose transferase-like glycosyltransferase
MEFLGDEGRDALIAKSILEGELTLLGPRSSAGDFYMGPFYYYIITPFLWIAGYDPVGPAIMVALFSVATVFLIYKAGRKFFTTRAALYASALYAVSPLVIRYSQSSWNPNILPFFSLLAIYTTYITVTIKKNWKYYLLIGFILGICLQLHYLSLFLIAVIGLFLIINNHFKQKKGIYLNFVSQIKNILLIALGILTSLSPLILFELRHNFLNTRGIYSFIFGNTVSYSADSNYFLTFTSVIYRIFSRLLFYFPENPKSPLPLNELISETILVAATLSISLLALFKSKNKQIILLLGLWLFVTAALFGFYKKEIYDYLFTLIFPLPFLLVGNMISYLSNSKNKLTLSVLGILIFTGLMLNSLYRVFTRHEPNNQRNQAKQIAEFIISKSEGKPYNFALLTPGNSDHAYKYYLELLGHPPVILENLEQDPKRRSVTTQLLIVCEDVNCKPLGHPLHDVAAFGRAEIEGEWKVSVLKVFKLKRYQPPK